MDSAMEFIGKYNIFGNSGSRIYNPTKRNDYDITNRRDSELSKLLRENKVVEIEF